MDSNSRLASVNADLNFTSCGMRDGTYDDMQGATRRLMLSSVRHWLLAQPEKAMQRSEICIFRAVNEIRMRFA
jgi:hypothetical protein